MIRHTVVVVCLAALILPATLCAQAKEESAPSAPHAPSAPLAPHAPAAPVSPEISLKPVLPPRPAVPAAEGVSKGEAIIREVKETPMEFEKATDVIKKGNEALKKGDDENAYCLFEEGVMRLESLKARHPSWEPDLVQKQIRNTAEVKDKLVAATCKNLEEMKEERFRFMVWRRQVVMLKKLDEIQALLEHIEEQQDEDHEDIRDIRGVLVR